MAIVEIRFIGRDETSGAARSAAGSVREIGDAAAESERAGRGLLSVMGGLGGIALGAMAGGIAVAGAALFDVSAKAATLKTSLAGLGDEDYAELLRGTDLLSARFGADMPGQVDTLRAIMANFGTDAAGAMDIITAGFEGGLNVSDDFLDTMKEYSPAFAGLGLSAEESLGILQRGLAAGARDTDFIADGLKELNIKLREAGTAEAVAPLNAGLAETVRQFQAGEITGAAAFDSILAGLQAIDDPVKQRAAGVALFGTKFEDLTEQGVFALGGVSEGLMETAGATDAAASRITSLGELGPRLFGELGVALLPLNTVVLEFVNAHLPAFIAGVTGMVGGVSSGFSQLQGVVGPVLATIAGLLAGEGTASLGTWGAAFTTAQGLVTGVMAAIQGIVGPVLAILSGFWATHGAEIVSFAGQAWTQIGTIVTTALQIVQGIVIPILTGIGGFISTHGAEIQSILGLAWGQVQTIVGGALSFIQGILSTVLSAIQGDWSGAWETLKQTAATLVTDIVKAVEGGMQLLEGVISLAWEGIKTMALSLGGDLVGGIISGVEAAGSGLFSALKGLAEGALDAAKQALGISSPSRRAAEELGAPMLQGWVGELDRGRDQLARAMGRLSDAAIGGGTTAAGSPSGTAGGAGRMAPAITINYYGPAGDGAGRQDMRALAYELAREIDRNTA